MHDNDVVPGWVTVPRELLRGLIAYVEGAAFWTAVFIPVTYVPLLLTGLSTLTEATLLVQLLGINALALVVGHGYAEEGPAAEPRRG